METYTIEQIEDAMRRDFENNRGVGRGFMTAFNDFKAELTRPKFSEGQVVYSQTGAPGGIHYFQWSSGFKPAPNLDMRPLNQAEVGDRWVPRKVAMKLREAADIVCSPDKVIFAVYENLRDSLNCFDEVVK